MGWTTGWNSRREMVAHLLQESVTPRATHKVLAHFFSGNNLWTVWERTILAPPLEQLGAQMLENPPEAIGKTHRYICLFLIRCYPVKGGMRDEREWGYKDIEETMGPCERTCPLKYLDMVPPIVGDLEADGPAKWSHDWREGVRAYWAKRAERQKERRARRDSLRGSAWQRSA